MKMSSFLPYLLLLSIELCFPANASADATVTACGKDVWPGDPRKDLSEALADGGHIRFACSGTIVFSRSHGIFKDVQIDGGGAVTLDGNGSRMFGVGSRSLRIAFKAIRIISGGAGPSGLPGSVVSGEGDVALLDGTDVSKCQKPFWVMAGTLDVRNARLHENAGPVLIVSEGSLDISMKTRFTDNTGQLLAAGPATRAPASATPSLLETAVQTLAVPQRRCARSVSGTPFFSPMWLRMTVELFLRGVS